MSVDQKAPKEIRLIINPNDSIAYAEQQLTEWKRRLDQWKIELDKKKEYIDGYVKGKGNEEIRPILEGFSSWNTEFFNRFSEICLTLDLSIDMVKLTMRKTMHLYDMVDKMLGLPSGTNEETMVKKAKEYGKILKYLSDKVAEEEEMRRIVKK
jgi:hypothetical protein